MKQTTNLQVFNLRDLSLNITNKLELNGFHIEVFHKEGDPGSANRIKVWNEDMEVEFLPSKGLSISQAWVGGKAIFWEAPIYLVDTETLDLWSNEISINGQASPGFTFLKTLVGGIELYGLRNWGMPVEVKGKTELLHGETSNIPVSEILLGSDGDEQCWIQASFIYRNFEGDKHLPWYERGKAIFKVTRKYTILSNRKEIVVEDSLENMSSEIQCPDWGYHITFRPENGAKLLVPSKLVEERGGNSLPGDIETWHPAEDPTLRTETGIIHKNLLVDKSESGSEKVVSLLKYPDHRALAVSVPPSPYFQTWFCNGGKGSKEFTDSKGESILLKNWDGLGLEIGSSALDHNGNIDKTVAYESDLKPGASLFIQIKIKWLDEPDLKSLERIINQYNQDRNTP